MCALSLWPPTYFKHPSLFTCLKQKGMVNTLTPTMLFTTFIIKPQLDDVILVFLKGTASISECFERSSQQWNRGVVSQLSDRTLSRWCLLHYSVTWRSVVDKHRTTQHRLNCKPCSVRKYFTSDTQVIWINTIFTFTLYKAAKQRCLHN